MRKIDRGTICNFKSSDDSNILLEVCQRGGEKTTQERKFTLSEELNLYICKVLASNVEDVKETIKRPLLYRTKEEEINHINKIQDKYVEDLITEIRKDSVLKEIFFTSPTGTGKSLMISRLINKLPNFFFIVTTLSKGQLDNQIEGTLIKECKNNNWIVYGTSKLKRNTILTPEEIINLVENKDCI